MELRIQVLLLFINTAVFMLSCSPLFTLALNTWICFFLSVLTKNLSIVVILDPRLVQIFCDCKFNLWMSIDSFHANQTKQESSWLSEFRVKEEILHLVYRSVSVCIYRIVYLKSMCFTRYTGGFWFCWQFLAWEGHYSHLSINIYQEILHKYNQRAFEGDFCSFLKLYSRWQ